jgi:hypothetical protein
MTIDPKIETEITKVVTSALREGTRACWSCGGTGVVPPSVEDALAPEPCDVCQGSGQIVPKWYEATPMVYGFVIGCALELLRRQDYQLAEMYLLAAQDFSVRGANAATRNDPTLAEYIKNFGERLNDEFFR